ncbi:MAG TPA: hypothetical protein VFE78_04875 [Gemmataceae bacterium]|nr:hypothetical protein [Gemmataceae bacterium]
MKPGGTAVWAGQSEETGFIKSYRGCDPAAVGHGFHEALNRHKGATPPYPFRHPEGGEPVAEAVRFFVEQRRGSSWRPTRGLQALGHCRYDFEEFKAAVRSLVAT